MFKMRPLSIPGLLALLVLLVVPVSHYAQAEVARAGNDPNVPPAAKPDSDIAHKLQLLEEQLRAQNGRIDQLTALIAEQQRLINQLVAARPSNTTSNAIQPIASLRRGTRRLADHRPQPNPAEDRIKKPKSVTKFGPFRSCRFPSPLTALFASRPNPPMVRAANPRAKRPR